MSKFRFLVDCDGPLSDFVGSALRLIEEKTGKRHRREEILEWDLFKSLEIDNGWEILTDAIVNDNFCYNMDVVAGSQKAISELQKFGEVFVVTSPFNAERWDFQRRQWLKKHFNIGIDKVVQTTTKHVISGDVIIDDKITNVTSWCNENIAGIGLLWDASYNSSFNVGTVSNIKRVIEWDHTIYTIKTSLGL